MLEEYVPGFGYLNSNVWGSYIDELVQRRYDQFNGDPMTGAAYYSLVDDLFSVTAVTDDRGAVVERYEYGDYGRPRHMDSSGFPANFASITGNTWFFTGREWDGETGFYHYRTRYMESGWGRFTTRDTIGVWGDAICDGNGTSYVGSRPASFVDQFGLAGSSSPTPIDTTYTTNPPNDRDKMPNDTRDAPGTFKDMIEQLEQETACGTKCIRYLRLDAHGCSSDKDGGTITTGKNSHFDIYHHDALPERLRNEQKNLWDRLGKMMCRDGRVQIVQCGAGKGEGGKRLRERLQQYTGHPVDVWPGNVYWADPPFGDPYPTSIPFINPGKQKRKPAGP